MKNLKVSYLLDFYGNLFNEKQREILEMYFQEDMSLAEIASVFDMTRQGVYDNIKRGEKEILSLEGKLNLMDTFFEISNYVETIETALEPGMVLTQEKYSGIKETLSKIKDII